MSTLFKVLKSMWNDTGKYSTVRRHAVVILIGTALVNVLFILSIIIAPTSVMTTFESIQSDPLPSKIFFGAYIFWITCVVYHFPKPWRDSDQY